MTDRPQVDNPSVRNIATGSATDPKQTYRREAFGINRGEPTGLAIWASRVWDKSGGMEIDKKVVPEVEREMAEARKKVDALWEAAAVDEARNEYKGVNWIKNGRALSHFSDDAVFKKNNMTQEDAAALSSSMRVLVNDFFKNVSGYDSPVEGPIKDEDPRLIEMSKDIAALTLVLRGHTKDVFNMGMTRDLKSVHDGPPRNYMTQEPDWGRYYLDKPEQIENNADAYVFAAAGNTLKAKVIKERLKGYFKQDRQDKTVEAINNDFGIDDLVQTRDPNVEIEYLTHRENQDLFRATQNEIETARVMLKGEIPDPAADLTKRLLEKDRGIADSLAQDRLEQEKLARQLKIIDSRIKSREETRGKIAPILDRLAEITNKVHVLRGEVMNQRILDASRKATGTSDQVLMMDEKALAEPANVVAFAKSFPEIAKLYGLDEKALGNLKPFIEGLNALVPHLDSPAKDAMMPAASLLLDKIRLTVGHERLDLIALQLSQPKKSVELPTLDSSLVSQVQDLISRSTD